MFERFTERARQVVVLAQEEARGLGHDYIGTEHILLGLFREEEGLGARALKASGLTLELTREDIAAMVIVPDGPAVRPGEDQPGSRQIPFTPRAHKVLELALREALTMGHNYIGTEHILLGLLRENEGVAARVIQGRDVDAERVRAEVIRLLSGPGAGRPKREPRPKPRKDGLTHEEGKVMDALCEAVDGFKALPDHHPSAVDDFVAAIHRCQDLLALRIAQRHYPEGWLGAPGTEQ